MKKLKITPPKGYEIDRENSTLDNIVFKEVKSKYPLSIEDIDNRIFYIDNDGFVSVATTPIKRKNNLSSKSRAEAFLALMQLVELRDAYNEIDGGKEFVYGDDNFSIIIYRNQLEKGFYDNVYNVLHFRKQKTRDLFLKRFKDLIETAKELI